MYILYFVKNYFYYYQLIKKTADSRREIFFDFCVITSFIVKKITIYSK